MKTNHILKKLLVVLVWLFIWQILYICVDSDLLFAGPAQTVQVLFSMMTDVQFYGVVLSSLVNVLSGFCLAFVTGIMLAAASSCSRYIRELLTPFFAMLKSVPVASFVILALLWIGSRRLSILVAFVVSLPIIYTGILTAITKTDNKILEMTHIFRFSVHSRVCAVYIPQISPFIISSGKLAIGMSFKAGVAAEVIACSAGSIGERLYMAKIYFQTGELFAWTAVIVLLSYLSELMFELLTSLLIKLLTSDVYSLGRLRKTIKKPAKLRLSIKNVSKLYGKMQVLDDISLEVTGPEIIAITGDSGKGKTTLLNIIMGLCRCDSGAVDVEGGITAVFQEQRLIEDCSALANVSYSIYNNSSEYDSRAAVKESVSEVLAGVLPSDCLNKKVKLLSGGERRRVEIVRALLGDSGICLFDEPFTGLDEANKQKMIRLIKQCSEGRIFVFAVHDKESLDALNVEKEIKL